MAALLGIERGICTGSVRATNGHLDPLLLRKSVNERSDYRTTRPVAI
jgi:hypothetical protein